MIKFSHHTRFFLLGTALVISLCSVRSSITHNIFYWFLLWNLFLAVIPFIVSGFMQFKANLKPVFWWPLFFSWLFFFPNAPYIVTDLIHLHARLKIPLWYDATLVFTAAFTGLWIGCASFAQMELLWIRQNPRISVHYFKAAVLMLCGFGVYLGRMLRFNSWDVVMNPLSIVKILFIRIISPMEYSQTWGVTIVFSLFVWVVHEQIKQVGTAKN